MQVTQKFSLADKRFLIWANCKANKKIVAKTARNVSRFGDGYIYFIISALAYFLAGNIGELFFWTSLLAYAIEMSLYLILKNTIRRPRPQGLSGLNALIKPSDTFSFPSGHTAGAFVYATITSVFVPQIALFTYFLAICIGLSRVVLGVHYPSDILAGAVLGFITAVFAMLLFGVI